METSSHRVTILFIQPRGAGLQALSTDVELRNLRDSLLRELHGDTLDWQVLPAARVEDLAWGLRYYHPAIIHFAGHGSRYGDLYLDASDDKGVLPLSAENLAETLHAYQAEARQPVGLAVLAGCYTSEAASIVAPHVRCAIGMNDVIGDDALAKVFTPNLYAALADGRSVQNAVDSARAELRNHDFAEDANVVSVFPGPDVDPARITMASLAQEQVEMSQSHKRYLHALFKERWATVRMKLFDPRTADVVALPLIYSPLPVDFSLRLELDEHGETQTWWCGRGQEERGEREAREVWEEALVERIERTAAREALPDQQARPRAWADLRADENALLPLRTLASDWARQQRTDRRGGRETETLHWQAEAEHAALVQHRFVLIGDPGSGKSTFLRHLALSWAAGRLREVGETRTRLDSGAYLDLSLVAPWPGPLVTPIYIELRPLVETFAPLPEGEDLPDMPSLVTFEAYLRSQLAAMQCEAAFDDLIALLEAGRAAILLDGLDEVGGADDHRRRRQVQRFVDALQEAFAHAPIMVTARPYAYRLDNPGDPERWELRGFGYTALVPLEPERQQAMAQRLFTCLRPGDRGRAAEFTAALSSVPQDLPANPLLLTLLAAVSLRRPAHEAHALPKTRGELYDRALTLLIEDWVKEHNEGFVAKKDIGLDKGDLRRALQLVARRAQERSTQPNQAVIIERSHFYDALDDIGKGESTPRLVRHLQWTAGMLLDQIEQSPGAMASPAPGRFRFLHLSFQEYLAACDMLYRPGSAQARGGRPLWDERPFPHELVRQVLQAPRLWANVLRLAVDELLARGRAADAWELLALCCQPYQEEGHTALAALLALDVTHKAGLFQAAPPWGVQHCYRTICDAAQKALADCPRDERAGLTPEQRDIAGRLLGSDPFPGHGPAAFVGVQNSLPDIQWVPIPNDGAWTYQNKQHKPLDPFWIAKYPITRAQFQTFVDDPHGFREEQWWQGLTVPPEHRSAPGDQRFEYWNHPRERVSWWDAMAFCAWLTAKAKDHHNLLPDGIKCNDDWCITLPTEQQWEKAARGHDGRRYPWGKEEYQSGYANIDEVNYKVGSHYLRKTSAVGMYPQGASPYGVEDLSGNVWEWCLNEYESGKTAPGGNARRVLRGGSWYYDHNNAAAPARFHGLPNDRSYNCGFRVVVVGCVPVPHL